MKTGCPLQFRITAGQAGEYGPAAELLEGQTAEAVIADRGYDADVLVAQSESFGAKAVIPPKCNRKLQRAYDRQLYKHRNRIDTMLQQAQTLPPLRHKVLQNHTGLPILHRSRMCLAQAQAICGYALVLSPVI